MANFRFANPYYGTITTSMSTLQMQSLHHSIWRVHSIHNSLAHLVSDILAHKSIFESIFHIYLEQSLSVTLKMPVTTRAMAETANSSVACISSICEDQNPMEANLIAPGRHPLLNDVILTTLFGYVQGNTLKQCRLVCKKWNDQTIKFTRSYFKIWIKESRPERGIEEFTTLMKSNTLGIPFGIYFIHDFQTTDEIWNDFVQLCGKTARQYSLEYYNGHHMIENVADLLKSSPQLEALAINTDMTSKHGDGGVVKLFPVNTPLKKMEKLRSFSISFEKECNWKKICPTFLDEFFGVAENITMLNISHFLWGEVRATHVDINLVLDTLEKLGQGHTIENLTLSFLSESNLRILQKIAEKPKGMKLKHLNFSILNFEANYVHGILSLCRDTLTSLNIHIAPNSNSYPDTVLLPSMPKLKEFCLFDKNCILTCVNFNHTFPILEKLRLGPSDTTVERRHNGLLTGDGSPNIKSIIMDGSLGLENLNRIITICPKLTMLKCRIKGHDGGDVLKAIWTHLTLLEKLVIECEFRTSENINSFITGIPVKEIRKIKRIGKLFRSIEGLEMEARKEKLIQLMNKHRQYPSIGNLTNLKFLYIHLITENARGKQNFLTDITGYFGLYSLKNLRHLIIEKCEFSAQCAEILTKDISLLTWFLFTSHSNPRIITSRLDGTHHVHFSLIK